MLGVYELLKMKGLQTVHRRSLSYASSSCVSPAFRELPFLLPAGGNFIAYGPKLAIVGTTVLAQGYTHDEVVYPIASSFMFGFGFHALIQALSRCG